MIAFILRLLRRREPSLFARMMGAHIRHSTFSGGGMR